jgi:hypothetical protein
MELPASKWTSSVQFSTISAGGWLRPPGKQDLLADGHDTLAIEAGFTPIRRNTMAANSRGFESQIVVEFVGG